MANTSQLKRWLIYLQGKLLQHPTFIRQHGVGVDDPAYQREVDELEQIQGQLALIVRENRSKVNQLTAKQQGLWKLAHDERYRAAASLKSQLKEVEDLERQAKQVIGLLEDLMVKNCDLGEGELAEGISKMIEGSFEALHAHGESQGLPYPMSYIPAHQLKLGNSIEGVTILVFAALHAYISILKRRKR